MRASVASEAEKNGLYLKSLNAETSGAECKINVPKMYLFCSPYTAKSQKIINSKSSLNNQEHGGAATAVLTR